MTQFPRGSNASMRWFVTGDRGLVTSEKPLARRASFWDVVARATSSAARHIKSQQNHRREQHSAS